MLSFARDDFDYYNPSAESLFETFLMKAKVVETATLPKETSKNYLFATTKDIDNIFDDDNGVYIVTSFAAKHLSI